MAPDRPTSIVRSRRLWVSLLVIAMGVAACGSSGGPIPCSAGDCIPIPSGEVTLAAELDLPVGPAPHPVLVMIHGSGPGTRQDFAGVVDTYRSIGVGVLRYDKRGAGESTGSFRDVTAENSVEVFDVLAADVRAIVDYLATQPGVDPDRIGLIGVSQAGWIMPLAASRSPRISYFISLSGAASSVGVSDHYDRIAEDTPDEAEIRDAMASFDGEHGYDPKPDLESLGIPALWIYGSRDLSNPTANDIEILEDIRTEQGKDWAIELFANADHDLLDATTGQPVNAQHVVNRWLAEHVTGAS